jgi:hypothetical protein
MSLGRSAAVQHVPSLREGCDVYKAEVGFQLRSGRRQSIHSNSIDSWAWVSVTVPLVACGQQAQAIAGPPQQLDHVAAASAKHEHVPTQGIFRQRRFYVGRQAVEAITGPLPRLAEFTQLASVPFRMAIRCAASSSSSVSPCARTSFTASSRSSGVCVFFDVVMGAPVGEFTKQECPKKSGYLTGVLAHWERSACLFAECFSKQPQAA